MPASNQLCSWNDIAVEVSANRMVWIGGAMSGNNVISWSQFISAVYNDGTNPGGYAANQCPPYSYLLARAITILPPATLTAAKSGSATRADWTAPISGLTPTSYKVEYFQNSVLKQTVTGVTGLTNTSNPIYVTGDLVNVFVYSVNGALTSTGTEYDFTF